MEQPVPKTCKFYCTDIIIYITNGLTSCLLGTHSACVDKSATTCSSSNTALSLSWYGFFLFFFVFVFPSHMINFKMQPVLSPFLLYIPTVLNSTQLSMAFVNLQLLHVLLDLELQTLIFQMVVGSILQYQSIVVYKHVQPLILSMVLIRLSNIILEFNNVLVRLQQQHLILHSKLFLI